MGRPQLHFRVAEEQRDRWEQYLQNNPEYDTLSDLIRTAVERHIAGSNHGGQTAGSGSQKVDAIDERTERLVGRVDQLESTVKHAVESMHMSGVQADDDTTTVWEQLTATPRTAEEIAIAVNGTDPAPERQVRKYEIILDQLANSTKAVTETYQVERNGTEFMSETPHYYKNV